MKRIVLLVAVLLSLCSLAHARKSPGFHHTRSYTRKDGTFVHGYYSGHGATLSRSSGGSSFDDSRSTIATPSFSPAPGSLGTLAEPRQSVVASRRIAP